MLFTDIKRIGKGGLLGFWRNGVVSLSSILVMVVALFMVGSTILMSAFLESTLAQLKDKVDINAYIVPDAAESDILALKSELQQLPEVSQVDYISQDQELQNFKTRHQGDQLQLQALDEVGGNPFGAVLNIKAVDPSQYAAIGEFLKSDSALSKSGSSIIASTNYNNNKVAIDRLSSIITGVHQVGIVIVGALVLISILITFNTIRLAIYTAREEIAVMRLVGARNYYIRGPFVIEGILYGIVAALISIALFYPITLWLKDSTSGLFQGIDLFQYYVANFNQIFLVIIGTGIILGALSSYLAVRKYLKV